MIQIDKFTALELREDATYGFSLLEGWVPKDGDWRPSMCVRTYGKDKIEKKVPVSVKLGDKDKAVEVVKWLYKELTGDSDVPF